jgi:DNA-binding MarR family transcriptional regulator
MTATQTRTEGGLATALRISVSRLARRFRAERTASGLTEAVLSETQLAALSALEVHEAMTPGELAEHEKVQPPSMTRVIAALLERDLVLRSPHPTDRRQVVLTVTAEGRAVVQRVRRRKDAWLARRLAELSAEERATLRAAVPILEKLSQSSLGVGQPRLYRPWTRVGRAQRPARQRGVAGLVGRAEAAADQVHPVGGPGRPLVAGQRGHDLGDVRGHPAARQGQVRLELAAPVGRRGARAAGPRGHGFSQLSQLLAVTAQAAPQYVRAGGGGESARAAEGQPESGVATRGALQPRQQPGRG